MYKPLSAVHPGESLLEALSDIGMTQVKLSERTGLAPKTISEIINGKNAITPETALALEHVLNIPASFWNNLDKHYKAFLADEKAHKALKKEIDEVRKFTCYNELAKLGFVAKTSDWSQKAENLMKFFRVSSLSFVSQAEGVGYRTLKEGYDEYALVSWLRSGEVLADKIHVRDFDKKLLKEKISEIRSLSRKMDENLGKTLREIFAQCGIALVFVPYFKNTKVHGATRWLGGRPVIQINTKGHFSDIFWFSLFHEMGHILLHGKAKISVALDFSSTEKNEIEADRFAQDQLIPPSAYKALLSKSDITRSHIFDFAKEIDIDPGIIAGRLAREEYIEWKTARSLTGKLQVSWSNKME